MKTEIIQSNKVGLITIFVRDLSIDQEFEISIDVSKKVKDLKKEIEELINRNIINKLMVKRKMRSNKTSLNDENASLKECHLHNGDVIFIGISNVCGGGGDSSEQVNTGESFNIEINIKFIKINKERIYIQSNKELKGLLKLCLLKEVSGKIDSYYLNDLPNEISWILKILKNGYIKVDNPKEGIVNVLRKMKGSNIINFSKYIDETVNFNLLIDLMNKLSKNDKQEIENIKNYLVNYI